ncbi:hypothetical protein D3C75_689500 [compost metagenome]
MIAGEKARGAEVGIGQEGFGEGQAEGVSLAVAVRVLLRKRFRNRQYVLHGFGLGQPQLGEPVGAHIQDGQAVHSRGRLRNRHQLAADFGGVEAFLILLEHTLGGRRGVFFEQIRQIVKHVVFGHIRKLLVLQPHNVRRIPGGDGHAQLLVELLHRNRPFVLQLDSQLILVQLGVNVAFDGVIVFILVGGLGIPPGGNVHRCFVLLGNIHRRCCGSAGRSGRLLGSPVALAAGA